MTRDDIIPSRTDVLSMAREAGFKASVGKTDKDGKYHPDVNAISRDVPVEWLERFAALIAAHIRETEFKPDWNNYRQGFADGAAEEREACAMLVENFAIDMDDEWVCGKAAEAIRARGQA